MKIRPRAFYRLQLNTDFDFRKTINNLDYFNQLGISHLYLSPCLQAVSGSLHGYDVVDHSKISQDLGGEKLFDELCHELEIRKMGIILDFVPNHMAVSGPENFWWWDILENGISSLYSRFFDVDWHVNPDSKKNLILLPILGNHYGRVLEAGELKIKHDTGKFTLQYYDHVFPVTPKSLDDILYRVYLKKQNQKLGFIIDSFKNLPPSFSKKWNDIQKRHRDKEVLQTMLIDLCSTNHSINNAIDKSVEETNNNIEELDTFIGKQNYKLAFWRIAKYNISYRRFFDINSLVALKMESKRVFLESHKLITELAKQGKIDGFRLDHPDGLSDPKSYFSRLKDACPGCLLYAEKILDRGEQLNPEWDIAGTTGYDFLNLTNGLFIESKGLNLITKYWRKISKIQEDFRELAYENKKNVIKSILGGEVKRLARKLLQVCENRRVYRDFSQLQLYFAIAEIAACFPVYRTYIQPEEGKISNWNRAQVIFAINNARKKNSALGNEVFDFIEKIMLLEIQGKKESQFILRFQQFTSSVMAKGIEDTTHYVFNPLISMNEVGGYIQSPITSLEEFHQWCAYISSELPNTMLTTSTHDTKRGEDVRARINILSEIPDKWISQVQKWLKINKDHTNKGLADKNTEYFLFQTLVGTWPISKERILKYMIKAVREAKVNTNWASPNKYYENRLEEYINRIFENKEFISSLEGFIAELIEYGRINSLAQITLKLTSPGIPDIYRGTEVWNNSLADPDNRRPFSINERKSILKRIEKMDCQSILEAYDEGLPKMFIIKKILEIRKKDFSFNSRDSYREIRASGTCSDNVLSYIRGKNLIVVVPRLLLKIKKQWKNTKLNLPKGEWINIFSEKTFPSGAISVENILKDFPVAVLKRISSQKGLTKQ